MPESYGLLSGIAQGLKSGFDTYREAEKTDKDNALKMLALKIQAANSGYDIGDDGTFSPSGSMGSKFRDAAVTKMSNLASAIATSEKNGYPVPELRNEYKRMKGLLSGVGNAPSIPRSIKQNGHVYNLNTETGQYE